MPKVKTVRCVLDGSIKQELYFKYDVYVNTEGEFTTTLPKDVVHLFEKAQIKMSRNRLHNPGFFSDTSFDRLCAQVAEVSKEYLSREVVSEKIVLRYSIETTCAYCIDDNKEIVPNGNWVTDFNSTKEKQWKNGTVDSSATWRKPFGLQIYVKPYKRIDYKFKSGTTKTDYNLMSGFGGTVDREETPYLAWLEGVTTIDMPSFNNGLKEIDYTEPVAAFFVMMLKFICNMNEKIKDFLEPEMIAMLVEKQFNLLTDSTSQLDK